MTMSKAQERAELRAKARAMYESGADLNEIAHELGMKRKLLRMMLKRIGVQFRKEDMQRSSKLKPEDLIGLREKIVALAVESSTWTEISKKLGWNLQRLHYWRMALDLGDDILKKKNVTKELLEEFFKAGKTPSQVAHEIGTSRARIVRLARKWGLPVQRERPKEWLIGRDRKELGDKIKAMAREGMPMRQIAENLAVPYIVVYYDLQKAGIHKVRTRPKKA